jgi:hypothetical protein
VWSTFHKNIAKCIALHLLAMLLSKAFLATRGTSGMFLDSHSFGSFLRQFQLGPCFRESVLMPAGRTL